MIVAFVAGVALGAVVGVLIGMVGSFAVCVYMVEHDIKKRKFGKGECSE